MLFIFFLLGLVSMAVIDQMAAEGMKDIDEMEDDSDLDENELLVSCFDQRMNL